MSDGEVFADQFSRFVNNMSSEPKKAAIAKMLRDHRTLQQGMMRFFMQFVEGMANNQHDLRNEASVELAKAILKIDDRTRILPRI
jgi:hypothetical protein